MQFGLQTQKLWALQGLGLIEKKKSSNIRPTYIQTLHILSTNIVTLTLVTNHVYHQTLSQKINYKCSKFCAHVFKGCDQNSK
jgi:hypothetical protein